MGAFPTLLAESLLHILESYGPDQFAAALVGDSGELGSCIQLEAILVHCKRLQLLGVPHRGTARMA